MSSPWHAASAAGGRVVNVSAMIVRGSAGAMLADTPTEEGYRVACPPTERPARSLPSRSTPYRSRPQAACRFQRGLVDTGWGKIFTPSARVLRRSCTPASAALGDKWPGPAGGSLAHGGIVGVATWPARAAQSR